MTPLYFRVWYRKEKKMYYRGYQKLTHVLLCDDDQGSDEGKGIPVKRVRYDDCEMLQGTQILDKNGVEVFEGDRIRMKIRGKWVEGVIEEVPDMFKSRGMHPFHNLLVSKGFGDEEELLEIEIIGNIFENPQDND